MKKLFLILPAFLIAILIFSSHFFIQEIGNVTLVYLYLVFPLIYFIQGLALKDTMKGLMFGTFITSIVLVLLSAVLYTDILSSIVYIVCLVVNIIIYIFSALAGAYTGWGLKK